jgi:hypothetical protein
MKEQIIEAIKDGLTHKGNGQGYGCGRAYVCLGKVDRKTLKAYQDASKQLNIRYLAEAYGSGKRALYIGYDNASGIPLAQSEAIANNLIKLGLPAYADTVCD